MLAGTVPGIQTMAGTRNPPSHGLPLLPRSSPAEPPSDPTQPQGPLSLVNVTKVFSASPSRRSAATISPTLQSISSTTSPYRPRLLPPARSGVTISGVCGAV